MDTANNHGFFDFHYIGTHNKLMNPMLLYQFFPNYHYVSKPQIVMHTKKLMAISKTDQIVQQWVMAYAV